MYVNYLNVAAHHGAFLHHGVHNVEQISGRRSLLSKINLLRDPASEINESVARVSADTNVIIAAIQSTQRTGCHNKEESVRLKTEGDTVSYSSSGQSQFKIYKTNFLIN